MLTSIRSPEAGAGSALVDMDGMVLGLVVQADNLLASAIPIETAATVGRSILEQGWPRTAWLGIEANGGDRGLRLTEIHPGGPAHVAGFRTDDVLTTINGARLRTMADLVEQLRGVGNGDTVTVEAIRDGDPFVVSLTIWSKPAA